MGAITEPLLVTGLLVLCGTKLCSVCQVEVDSFMTVSKADWYKPVLTDRDNCGGSKNCAGHLEMTNDTLGRIKWELTYLCTMLARLREEYLQCFPLWHNQVRACCAAFLHRPVKCWRWPKYYYCYHQGEDRTVVQRSALGPALCRLYQVFPRMNY